MTEGKKTVSLELCEQLGWEPPDAVFVSVGDGSIIGGVHKGLKDLVALGWIDRMPRIFGVQAAGSDYLVQAFENDEDVVHQAADLGGHGRRLDQRRPAARPGQGDERGQANRRRLRSGE